MQTFYYKLPICVPGLLYILNIGHIDIHTVRGRGVAVKPQSKNGRREKRAWPWDCRALLSSFARRICKWGFHSRDSASYLTVSPRGSAWGRPAGKETGRWEKNRLEWSISEIKWEKLMKGNIIIRWP